MKLIIGINALLISCYFFGVNIIAKISEKNKRFRTKDQMCKDLSTILNLDLIYGTKFSVVNEVLWVWSEYDGKHKGCKFWSKEACNLWEKQKPSVKSLIHEHLVPRNILIKLIFSR